MTTTEAWAIINDREQLEYHGLFYFQGDDVDDLIYVIGQALNLPKVRMSPRYKRLVAIQTVLRNSKKAFDALKYTP